MTFEFVQAGDATLWTTTGGSGPTAGSNSR